MRADKLKTQLAGDGEIALIDVREDADFNTGHLLTAVNVPLSRFEQLITSLVPRSGAPIVVCDANDGLAERAAQLLQSLGYSDVETLAGGIAAWEQSGGGLFSGTNLPSKAFGEFVEEVYHTPHISAEELKARIDRGDDLVILDSRPFEEFRLMSIPGGICCPGAELAYRAREAIPSAETLVVVNCAGRTRSIIGAQSLINSGLTNRVVALEGGTMSWQLAGYQVAENASSKAPPVTTAAIEKVHARAMQVAQRSGVQLIDMSVLERFREERDERTLYVFDVRTPEEFEAGHLADAVHAFGGQLVQTTDKFIAVRGARIVLVDDTEVRALMTASWLRQMGWHQVHVLKGGVLKSELLTGARRSAPINTDHIVVPTIKPEILREELDAGRAVLIDMADPKRFMASHIAGAWYAVRSKLPAGLERFADSMRLVFTSSDGVIAKLTAHEITRITGRVASVLEGGTAAWKAAMLPMESGDARKLHPRIEPWSPYETVNRTQKAMQDYLSWEVDLYARVKEDTALRFRTMMPASNASSAR